MKMNFSAPEIILNAWRAGPRMKFPIALFAFLFLLPPAIHAAEWETWKNCRLIPNDANDADSFHVSYQGGHYIIRLYFVDAPETDKSFPDRVAEQVRHHGKTADEVLHTGRYASAATAELLSRPFTVVTSRQDAMGRSSIPRFFGFVTTSDGEDLGEVLMANGLARSYGAAAQAPGKPSVASLRARYDHLEKSAKRKGYGIYSPAPLRSINRANSMPSPDFNATEERAPSKPTTENDSFLLGPDF